MMFHWPQINCPDFTFKVPQSAQIYDSLKKAPSAEGRAGPKARGKLRFHPSVRSEGTIWRGFRAKPVKNPRNMGPGERTDGRQAEQQACSAGPEQGSEACRTLAGGLGGVIPPNLPVL